MVEDLLSTEGCGDGGLAVQRREWWRTCCPKKGVMEDLLSKEGCDGGLAVQRRVCGGGFAVQRRV